MEHRQPRTVLDRLDGALAAHLIQATRGIATELTRRAEAARHAHTAAGITADRVLDLLHDESPLPQFADVLSIGPTLSTWTISQAHARFLARLVLEIRPARVLEFGAGYSSVVLARALQEIGGGQLSSVDQDPEWCARLWSQVSQARNVDARLIRW